MQMADAELNTDESWLRNHVDLAWSCKARVVLSADATHADIWPDWG